MKMKWCSISDAVGPIAHEWAEDGSVTVKDGLTVEYFDMPQEDKIAALKERSKSPKLTALLAIDPTTLTGDLKIVVEFLQRNNG